MARKDNPMKKNIKNANIEEGKVYLFEDGEVYTAILNESFHNNNVFKYNETRIPDMLVKVIYDESREVAFSSKHNAMEFDNTADYNQFVTSNGKKMARLFCAMFDMEIKKD